VAEPTDIQRRLVAVFAADVEGYSRLMGSDEVGTLRGLTERRAILDKAIADHRGRIANTAGDSVLAEFGSAVDAVHCAVEAQAALAEANIALPTDKRINFRIGIHVGDVMVRAGDLFGDGVNIAARLQALAQPGGLCVSGTTYEHVKKVVPVAFTDLGAKQVKNIEEPVRAYGLATTNESDARAPTLSASGKPLSLPDKPSIAVLPFQNMSGDPEQEYFADGMVEDIITALSRFKSLFVIARNSSFTFKGKAVDIKHIGRELGVRYVLEGSVRKAGGRVRITGQLIDAQSGAHLWADKFDGALDDVFDLQDRVTQSVVGQLMTQLQFAEMDRAIRKPTSNLDAYDCYLRGIAHLWKWTKTDVDAALAYFKKALELDPRFSQLYGWAGMVYTLRKQSRWMVNVEEETTEAIGLARKAIELNQNDEVGLCFGGFTLAYVAGELELAADCIRQSLSMNSNFAIAWNHSGWLQMYLGQHHQALEDQAQAERLSPRDPNIMQVRLGAAFAHFCLGQYQEATALGRLITDQFPSFNPAWRVLAAGYALAGDESSAGKALMKALELDPSQRLSTSVQVPFRRREDRERWTEGLRKAGLPE
jgi:TolB-like protein/class 3 adenylate cyclase/Tfp pilus assembly protein PilF